MWAAVLLPVKARGVLKDAEDFEPAIRSGIGVNDPRSRILHSK